jgi:hypothetical protein
MDVVAATADEELWTALGPGCEPYQDHTLVAFAHHQLDEAIHHGAEVALLRDLYPHRSLRADGSEATGASLAEHEDAVARAADLGRWDLVEELVLAGHPVATPGRNALHQACALGDVEMAAFLLDHGADPATKDPDFDGDALVWARYFGRTEVAALLLEGTAP